LPLLAPSGAMKPNPFSVRILLIVPDAIGLFPFLGM
jgi:hypothetical protein